MNFHDLSDLSRVGLWAQKATESATLLKGQEYPTVPCVVHATLRYPIVSCIIHDLFRYQLKRLPFQLMEISKNSALGATQISATFPSPMDLKSPLWHHSISQIPSQTHIPRIHRKATWERSMFFCQKRLESHSPKSLERHHH